VDAQEKIGRNRRSGVKSAWEIHAKTYFEVDIPTIPKYKLSHYRIKVIEKLLASMKTN
jgi:hypothetical protein